MYDDNGELVICQTTKKRCYGFDEAQILIKRCSKHRGHKGAYIPKRSYYCNYCHCYHLTSEKKNKKRFIPYLMVFLLVLSGCSKQETTKQDVVVQKITYYTVMQNGIKYQNLRLYYQSECGDTFKMQDGRKISFRGNYLFYEQEQMYNDRKP